MSAETKAAPVTPVAEPHFADPRTAARYTTLRNHASHRAAGWRHVGPRKLGNRLLERWCAPTVATALCDGGAVSHREARGTRWMELSTFFFPRTWPEVFGLAWSAGDLPESGPWGVVVTVALGGGRIAGTGFSGRFVRLDGAEPSVIPFGLTWERKVGETRFAVSAPGEGEDRVLDEMARLLASPASLRDTLLARIAALDAEVRRGLAAGEARKCRHGAYEGHGIPPTCTLVPLADDEIAEARAALDADLGRWRGLVERDASTLHAALGEVLPAEAWPR